MPIEANEFMHIPFPDTTLVEGGLLSRGGRLIIAGETGTGKSYLALQLVFESVLGLPWLGLYPVRNPLRSYIVETEVTDVSYQGRLWRIADQLPIPDGMLYVDTPKVYMILEEHRKAKIFADGAHIELVVFDPLYQMHDSDENAVHTIRPVERAFDSVAEGRAVILVHHTRKPTDGPLGISSLRGSSAWAGWADTVFLLVGKPGARFVWLHILKARNRQEGLPNALKLEWQKPGRFFRVVDESADSSLAHILEIVQQGPVPRATIVKMLVARGLSRTVAYRAVQDAETLDVIREISGKLGLGEDKG